MKSYSMHSVMGAANRAVAVACQWMRAQAPQATIHNVQDEPRFQYLGVDLLWEKQARVEGVEVKGDRSRGQRFFFELVSNFEKNTPGCFLYSKADWLLYVFLPLRQLYALPLPQIRHWLLPLVKNFPLKKTHTHAGPISYSTLGLAVPVSTLRSAFPNAPLAWQQKENEFLPL